MRVKAERIQNDLENLSRFGGLEGGGISRLAFTSADREARDYLRDSLALQGLGTVQDAMGNMRARRHGTRDLAPVMIGSHLDSVPSGGCYDGAVGIVAALEVIRVLDDLGIETRRPIEVINFSAEESSRFGASTLGSKAMTGHLSQEHLHMYKDKDGVSLYEAMKLFGLNPDGLESVRIQPGDVYAFIEMHIEQGRVLESFGIPLGIVTSIAAPTRIRVFVIGRADHSGATPMDLRADALTAASEIILGVERIASVEAGPHTVGTVGYANAQPGVLNVIPGKVELGIDIRDIDKDSKDLAVRKIISLLEYVGNNRGVKVDYRILADETPVTLSGKIIGALEEAAQALGYPYRLMPSGAGHDAMYMAEVAETGMIFVPSREGISHNVAEYTAVEDIARGAELLLEAVLHLANEE
ncbi:MAG TPA: Zn-dependent hydrolase [Bacillota bacterium]|jgi:N-carbamoyl-L-amino-acid hydrolase|nr:Zn-dependent hydrolase [Bacillota bacterium]HPU62058.1 Zn-dependent hydrolase [Bacillota bacterium]HPZ92993.1 Zn-dependent hydrolase [Bacillota bacterium]HQE04362.1 Zn-dependent hydrolase [Bacillota bacterium]